MIQLTYDFDEIEEKFKYMELKYHALINRMGVS
jgi:hypothetical protein